MYPHQVIYQFGKSKIPGEVKLSPGLIVRMAYHTLRGFGAGLVAFAVVGVIFTFGPIAKTEFIYQFGTKEQAEVSKFTEIVKTSRAKELGLDPYFSLFIPKIDAKAKVIANVNAGNPKEYLSALQEGVAHAAGTNFPGQGKTVYLFSHSTDSPVNIARYNAIFYLLRKLEPGDRVLVYFLDQEHEYVVTEKLVTDGLDTTWMKDDGQGERLVLQTCDPPGTTWKRLMVIAKPI
jgi:LPXTG-site transpeptidase (sortase) family protein